MSLCISILEQARVPRAHRIFWVGEALRAGIPVEELHRLILDLRPSVLDDLGLASAVRWYADRALTARGVAVVGE